MAPRQQFPPELKAQVIAAHQLGTPKSQIARELKVSRGYVQQVTRDQTSVAVLSTEKRADIGMLVYEYLTTGLEALIAQNREVGKADYITAQPADALYLLHGTIADKLIALFGAIERGPRDDGEALDVS